jgi:low affinity Fe/Cu permease
MTTVSRPQKQQSALLRVFRQFAHNVAHATGSPVAFVFAVIIILAWAITGPIFHFSDTWQLIINTGTTIITFLMVFLIQNTQNRDSQVVQLKLNELIRALASARNDLVDLEELSDEELNRLQEQFAAFHRKAVDVRAHRQQATAPRPTRGPK